MSDTSPTPDLAEPAVAVEPEHVPTPEGSPWLHQPAVNETSPWLPVEDTDDTAETSTPAEVTPGSAEAWAAALDALAARQ